MEPLLVGPDPRGAAGSAETLFDYRPSPFADPYREPHPNDLRPALLLAACGRQRLLTGGSGQIGHEGPNVVSDIDVLREAADHLVTPSTGTYHP